MSSSSNLESVNNTRNPSSVSPSSCSKMVHLASGGNTGVGGVPLEISSQQTSIIPNNGNVHCSLSQQSGGNGGGGLAPIMEIREMNSYCNSCVTVGADKYWNHHHPHANVSRHAAVYPQMFYTPPPPPHPHTAPPPPPTGNYSVSGGGSLPTSASSSSVLQTGGVDWSCPPPPPSTADSYSHFIYSQYPPPPSQHHDYNNYLSISTSCYESDMMMMSTIPPPPASSASQMQNNCDSSGPTAMMNSFMYPAPLPPPQLPTFESAMNSTTQASTLQQPRTPVKIAKPESSFPPQPPALTSSTSGDSTTDESDDEDDDDCSHIISIEDDDDNEKLIDDVMISSPSPTTKDLSTESTSSCVLCKRPASLMPVLPQNAPSPQLSRILDNIDDEELDISVCSGDIEIGGIEDEMIQQATEQQQQRISIQRLSQLVGLSVMELISCQQEGQDVEGANEENINQAALLCSKCQKLVGMAESLEKQLTSVLSTLRQVFSLEDGLITGKTIKVLPAQVFSIGIQTEDYDMDSHTNNIIQVRRCNDNRTSNAHQPVNHLHTPDKQTDETFNDNAIIPSGAGPYLCHECGRNFNCKKNLGKHLKRHHHHVSNKLATCSRESCGKTFFDKTALQVHLRTHTNEKPYFCVNCLKLFTTKSNLTAHIKSNICYEKTESVEQFSAISSTREIGDDAGGDMIKTTTFRCENCGLTFRTEQRFQKHLSNNNCNKTKVHECNICSKLFAKRSELQTHQKVHTKEKSFQCDICGMAFSTRGNQRVHQRTHFTQKRFKCQHCDKGFTRNQTLQIHMVNAHG